MVVTKGALILLSSFFIVTAVVVSHDEAPGIQVVDVKLAVSEPPAAGPLLTTTFAPTPAPAEISPPPAPVKARAPPNFTGAPTPSISLPPAIATPPALSSPPDTAPPPAAPRPSVTWKDCIPLCLKRCHLRPRKKACMRACMKCCDRCRCVPPGSYGNREACGNCYTHDSNGCKCP